MGSLFRSEEMALAQLFLQPEAAYYSISELGEIGVVQFRDLNQDVNLFQRKFVNEVRRCDHMERRLRYIESELRKDEVTIPDCVETPKAPNPREIIDLEAHLEKTEGDILELSESAVSLKSHYLELTELKYVLEKAKQFFNEQDEVQGFAVENRKQSRVADENQTASFAAIHFAFVAGVINRDRIPAFERMLWRVSRGNVFVRLADIDTPLEDPVTGFTIHKTVFAIFFQGDELKSRIKKICAGFRASLYACPNTARERSDLELGVHTRLEDLKLVLNQTQDHRTRVLVNVAKELQNWSIMVRKMKAIYHTLNLFNMDVSKKCLIGECWLPIIDRDKVQQALSDGSNLSGSSIPSFYNIIETTAQPPTFNRTNKFTVAFQNLIDAYAIASYREVNPAMYTFITFPFLFAVMFGDVGHGIIVVLAAIAFIMKEEQITEKSKGGGDGGGFYLIFGGRYIILLMGIFSIYTGFIYNDFFSKPVNIFSSSWYANYNESTILTNTLIQLNPDENYHGVPYPVGVDPIWQFAQNKIIFLNSYKMKMSIIFGVIHMIFGVCISLVNHIYFKKYLNVIFDFIPQLLFLIFLFFWMVVMMFLKWVLYGPNREVKYGSFCAPSVLIYFINMILLKGTVPAEECEEFMFDGQYELQLVLLVGALLCIPVMLFGKPFYIMYTRSKKSKISKENGAINQGMELQSNEVGQAASTSIKEEEELPMSEVFIGQGIHTIEYALSTVSHTASYLRLWALSLAHAQLSHVLWTMVLNMGLGGTSYTNAIILYLVFYAWSFLTVFILVVMEGMSAFLHTLRLHWVEFMTKFYEGFGYAFQPFSFTVILETEEVTE